jgi:hypothetical protein
MQHPELRAYYKIFYDFSASSKSILCEHSSFMLSDQGDGRALCREFQSEANAGNCIAKADLRIVSRLRFQNVREVSPVVRWNRQERWAEAEIAARTWETRLIVKWRSGVRGG